MIGELAFVFSAMALQDEEEYEIREAEIEQEMNDMSDYENSLEDGDDHDN